MRRIFDNIYDLASVKFDIPQENLSLGIAKETVNKLDKHWLTAEQTGYYFAYLDERIEGGNWKRLIASVPAVSQDLAFKMLLEDVKALPNEIRITVKFIPKKGEKDIAGILNDLKQNRPPLDRAILETPPKTSR